MLKKKHNTIYIFFTILTLLIFSGCSPRTGSQQVRILINGHGFGAEDLVGLQIGTANDGPYVGVYNGVVRINSIEVHEFNIDLHPGSRLDIEARSVSSWIREDPVSTSITIGPGMSDSYYIVTVNAKNRISEGEAMEDARFPVSIDVIISGPDDYPY